MSGALSLSKGVREYPGEPLIGWQDKFITRLLRAMEGLFNVGLTIFGQVLASLLHGVGGHNGDKGEDDNHEQEFHAQTSFLYPQSLALNT
jgi:hypothetical protein